MKAETYYASKYEYDINLRYCGYEECSSDFRMAPHVRSEYLIHYVTQGEGEFVCGSRTYPVRQHDLFIIQPQQIVSYKTIPENPLHFSWIAFVCEKSSQQLALLGFSEETPVRRLHPQYSIDENIHHLVELTDSPGCHNEFAIQSIIYSIMSNIAQSYSLSGKYKKNTQTAAFVHVKKAKSYIKCNYIYPISVTDIAKHVGLERSYLSKIFSQCTGSTIQKYLLNVRIQRSKFLLEQTDYSIKEISFSVGMTDEYYFSRVFRQTVGVPPTRYRSNAKTHLSPL